MTRYALSGLVRKLNLAITLLLLILFTGCSITQNTVDSNETLQEPIKVEAEMIASDDWHLLAADDSPYIGTGVDQAYTSILSDKSPKKEVIVAIIDSGTDIEHEDLAGNIWVNEDEIPDNGIDDDGNGYVDDVHGWNFIGGADGESVAEDTYEMTRLYVKMSPKFEGVHPDSLDESQLPEYKYYLKVKKEYEAKAMEAEQGLMNYMGFMQAVQSAEELFQLDDLKEIDPENLIPNTTDTPQLAQAKQVAAIVVENDLTKDDIQEGIDYFEKLYKFGVNPEFDPRDIVGDNYDDLSYRFYGNNDVAGVHNDHGTHVAGIVGAIRNNEVGMDGIADVKLMIIRVVPDGDERDKDVANGIRYAAENGADIINMSFGKGFSPQKDYVDAAVRYADSVGVLLIHAAGNDGNDIDTTSIFPTRYYLDGNEATNWMNIGASNWKTGAELPASFSNFGQNNVDVFAPGVDIYSTTPDNTYEANDGTSMAAPVVSGVAALIMSYYPEFTAKEVKQILMNSVTKPEGVSVNRPGSMAETTVPFTSLSITGGIVNAYNALKLAELQSQNK